MSGWRGLTTTLWPIRYKPFPDELLSSWLMRIAHGHGLKAQTFCNLIFGTRYQVWNRDVDRLAPPWLIDALVQGTGVSTQTALETTLHAYEGQLYRNFRSAGALQWIQTLHMYHRKRMGYGIQFCPACLRECEQIYYRRASGASASTRYVRSINACCWIDVLSVARASRSTAPMSVSTSWRNWLACSSDAINAALISARSRFHRFWSTTMLRSHST